MIQRYVIADIASGEIVRTALCDDASADGQAGDGEHAIASDEGSRLTHHLVDGILVPYSEAQATAKAAAPAHPARWDNTTMTWVDARSLEQMREDKWSEIKEQRAARIAAAGVTSVAAFDTNAQGLANITSVALGLIVNPGIQSVRFTCSDNVRREISRADFIFAAVQIMAAVQSIYDTADELRQRKDAAATAEDLAAIVWPA